MKTTRFGRSQLKNPTPAGLSSVIAVFTVIAGIIITWLGTIDFIKESIVTIIVSVLGLLVAIGNGVKPFFGVETQLKEINIDNVSEMEVK